MLKDILAVAVPLLGALLIFAAAVTAFNPGRR